MDDNNLNNLGGNNNNVPDQNPQDNPYYNPYFNNDLNSPYYSNDNSSNVYQSSEDSTNLFGLADDQETQSNDGGDQPLENLIEQQSFEQPVDQQQSIEQQVENMQPEPQSFAQQPIQAEQIEQPIEQFLEQPSEQFAAENPIEQPAQPIQENGFDNQPVQNTAFDSEPILNQSSANPFETQPMEQPVQQVQENGIEQNFSQQPIYNPILGNPQDFNAQPMNNQAGNQFEEQPMDNQFNNNNFNQVPIGTDQFSQPQMNNTDFNQGGQPINDQFGLENDENFKKAWMGKLYEKQNKKFSIPSFFFGGLYFLFRKMYLYGFGIILLQTVLFALPVLFNSISIYLVISIILFILAFVYGFIFYPSYRKNVNKKLEKSKTEAKSPSDLITTASQNGGTSIGFLLLGILFSGLLSTIVFSLVARSLSSNLQDTAEEGSSYSNPVVNEIYEIATYDSLNFYKNYYIDYDASSWDESDGVLINSTYSLSYIQSIDGVLDYGYDVTTSTGRADFFTFLYNLFSSQIDTTTQQLELGSSKFTLSGSIYYAYLDLVYETSMERCYFVIIPEDDIMVEFVLANEDTVVSEAINTEVLEYLSDIYYITADDENSSSNIVLDQNELSNEVVNEANTTSTNITENEIVNETSNEATNNTTSRTLTVE